MKPFLSNFPYKLLFAFVLSINTNAFAVEYGVGTHFGQGKGSPALLYTWSNLAGISSFRDEIYWGQIEKQPGEFVLSGNSLNSFKIFETAKQKGLNPILILSYGNKFYDNGSQPFTYAGRSAFSRYVEWLVTRLKGSVEYYEVWNEWNIGGGTKPRVKQGSAKDYVLLAQVAYSTIKKNDPDAKVILGSLGDDLNGFPWLKEAISLGLLNYADGVSVHLYNHCMGTRRAGADEALERLKQLQMILRTSNHGKSVPIFVTEVGWPTNEGQCGIPENVSSEQMLRFLIGSKEIEDIKGIWWYELLDGGDDSRDREHRFGLFRTSMQEKPSACRLRSVQNFIKNAKLVYSKKIGDVSAFLLKGSDGRQLLTLWSGSGYEDSFKSVRLTGAFQNVTTFDQECGDRIAAERVVRSQNKNVYQVSTYPTLFWLSNDQQLGGFEVLK